MSRMLLLLGRQNLEYSGNAIILINLWLKNQSVHGNTFPRKSAQAQMSKNPHWCKTAEILSDVVSFVKTKMKKVILTRMFCTVRNVALHHPHNAWNLDKYIFVTNISTDFGNQYSFIYSYPRLNSTMLTRQQWKWSLRFQNIDHLSLPHQEQIPMFQGYLSKYIVDLN